MRRFSMLFLGAGLLIILSAAGCARHQPLIVSGTILQQTGEQFISTANLMDEGRQTGKITPELYARWRDFGLRFQQLYPVAIQAWKSAREVDDAASTNEALRIIEALARELETFTMSAISAFGGKP